MVSVVGGAVGVVERTGAGAARDRRCPLVAMGETPYSPVELAGNFGAGNRFLWQIRACRSPVVAHSDCIRVNCSPFSKAARAKKSASSSGPVLGIADLLIASVLGCVRRSASDSKYSRACAGVSSPSRNTRRS